MDGSCRFLEGCSMSLRAIARNVRKHGVHGMLHMRRDRAEAFEQIAQLDALSDEEYCTRMYQERPYEKLHSEKDYRACMDAIYEREKRLKAEDRKAYNRYTKGMRRVYIKERIPALYAERVKKPVTNKVVFMETGNCPSPSSAHISDVIKKQGKYKVKRMGLHRRTVSELEFYERGLDFIREVADAKAIFFSTANDMLSDITVRPETKVIQLWHGVGIFKKVGFSTVGNKNFGRSAKDREAYDQYGNYSYVTIASRNQVDIFEDSFRISRDSGIFVDVGVSRTDVFFDEAYMQESRDKLLELVPQSNGKKVILYAPTFRGSTGNGKAPDALDIDMLGEALSDEYVLLIKHHGLAKNIPPIPEKWDGTFAFDMNARKGLSIERLLGLADICITDYSSIAFEYSIMERPILFFAYDLEDYMEQRGLYAGFEEMIPGPLCRTNEELVDYIANVSERFDKQRVQEFRKEYVGACDGHATERTIKLIEGIVEIPEY